MTFWTFSLTGFIFVLFPVFWGILLMFYSQHAASWLWLLCSVYGACCDASDSKLVQTLTNNVEVEQEQQI